MRDNFFYSARNKLVYFLLVSYLFLVTVLFFLTQSPLPCANSLSCLSDLSGQYQEVAYGQFMGQIIKTPARELAETKAKEAVLGQAKGVHKHIYIDLSRQLLEAYEDEKLVMSFPVSSGKWAQTPTGTFQIWVKLRWTRMAGGNKTLGTFYDLPNVPHVMYFFNSEIPKTRGFGLHGAYWHNNFGHPMSHGCVNIGLENAAKLYAWADPPAIDTATYASADNPGTQLTIYGQAPKED